VTVSQCRSEAIAEGSRLGKPQEMRDSSLGAQNDICGCWAIATQSRRGGRTKEGLERLEQLERFEPHSPGAALFQRWYALKEGVNFRSDLLTVEADV
jgi:hypothetical protein